MSYTLSWYVPQRIIYVPLQDPIALSELGEIQTKVDPFHQEGIAPIHMIVDATAIRRPIFNIREMRSAGLTNKTRSTLGQVIVIQNNILLRQFATLLIHVFSIKINLTLVTTFEEAIQAIKARDITLQDMDMPAQPPMIQPEN